MCTAISPCLPFAFSNRELGPDAAYRFAKGETISYRQGYNGKNQSSVGLYGGR